MRLSLPCALASALLSLVPKVAGAVPITFEFTATIDEVSVQTPGFPDPGTTLTGSYTFESTTPDVLPADPSLGSYDDPLLEVALFFGGLSVVYTPTTHRITVRDFGMDRYDFRGDAFSGTIQGGGGIDGNQANVVFNFTLVSNDGSPFDSDLLPLFPPTVGAFENRRDYELIVVSSGQAIRFRGAITSITPEPSSGLLLGFGLGLLALRRRVGRHLMSPS